MWLCVMKMVSIQSESAELHFTYKHGLSQGQTSHTTHVYCCLLVVQVIIKGELQRQSKLITSERLFKILENETKIITIDQGVLERFKDRNLAAEEQ